MNNFFKHILIRALSSQPVNKLATRILGSGLPIFMLHRMDSGSNFYTGVTPEHLRRCLDYLYNHNFHTVSLEEAVLAIRNKTQLPDKSVVFTLDDGYSDQAEIAAPIFIEYECPATIFVITSMIDDGLYPWDARVTHMINTSQRDTLEITLANKIYRLPLTSRNEKYKARQTIRDVIKTIDNTNMENIVDQLASATGSDTPLKLPDDFRPLSWDAARELEKKGIKFAPHSSTHRMLSRLNDESSEQEITGSWERVEEELASPTPIFCYPTGRHIDYGQREIDIIKRTGLIGAVSSIPGCAEPENNSPDYVYNLPRFSLPTLLDDFVQCCTWIERIKN